MLIHTDLSTETSPGGLQQKRAEASAATRQSSSINHAGPAASQLDPSLQRLTETPASIQDTDFEIQNEAGASQAVTFLRQSMLSQPAAAMAAQANQSYQDVLSLLPATG